MYQRLPFQLLAYGGRDRHKSPFIALAREAPESRQTEYPLTYGREFRVTIGGWSVPLQFSRTGFAIGRLWVEWL